MKTFWRKRQRDQDVHLLRLARKARDLTRKRDEDRQAFFQAALPIMGKVMQERGALAILDSRAIFLSVRSIDATDEMIAAIDKALRAWLILTFPKPSRAARF